jgi:GDPmannose 4,6-dehydratase
VKSALISGVTGQTGAYLAHHLLNSGYRVIGGTRDAGSADCSRLARLGVLNNLELISLAPADFRSVIQILRAYQPDEIYYLAGQTSVSLSFDQPFEAFESIAIGTLNFLESIRLLDKPCRFFNAGSTESFGSYQGEVISESSPLRPISPYAVAKATSFWMTCNYRQSYGIHACTGLLSNHESPLRPTRFVTSKIVNAIHRIKAGEQQTLHLGNLSVARDWGWAPDYVKAIHKIMLANSPTDYIVATGYTHSLTEMITQLCDLAGLVPEQILRSDNSLLRPTDLQIAHLSSAKIQQELGWRPSTSFPELINKLFYDQLF